VRTRTIVALAAASLLVLSLTICGCHGTPQHDALGGDGPDEGTANYPWTQKGTHAGQEIVGPHGGKMVWIPKTFVDTSPEDHYYIYGVWIGKHEVSNARFAQFLNNCGEQNVSQLIDIDSQYCNIAKSDGTFTCSNSHQQHPVVPVTWDGANYYCEHYGLELPTMHEWLYAFGSLGESGTTYPWGNTWDASKCCCTSNNSGLTPPTMPVDALPQGASWCGALNMAGNAFEWTGTPTPSSPSGVRNYFMIGGSCFWGEDFCSSQNAMNAPHNQSRRGSGFRVSYCPAIDNPYNPPGQ
jgi:hypothetical protein